MNSISGVLSFQLYRPSHPIPFHPRSLTNSPIFKTVTFLCSSTATADPRTHIHLQSGEQHLPMGDPSLTDVDEDASPISSRPPAVGHISAAGNFEEFLPAGGVGTSHHDDEDALGGDEADRGRVGIAGGNRWPREETLALLKIRSEMDSVFRDATLKTPLWEDISRKLAELGYKRSAKKCKEKFENLHKYYKRTKEGRAARQDGKSYRFFSQLEALHSTGTGGGSVVTNTSPSMLNPPPSVAATSATNFPVIAPPTPVSSGIGVVNPMPLSSVRMPPPHTKPLSYAQVQVQGPLPPSVGTLFPDLCGSGTTAAPGGLFSGSAVPIGGIGFSLDSSSTYSGSDEFDEDEDGEMEIEGNFKGGEQVNTRDRKRKRVSSSGHGSGGGSSSQKRMMKFFEGLIKQVVRKQEEMQQRFLEALEKREQDMMIREEAWKRQEMARFAREHELIAQERSVSAARDAAIIAFIQKFTGQTIQLPSAAATVPAAPPPPPPPQPPPQTAPQPPLQSSSSQRHYQKPQEVHQPQQQHKQQQQQMEEKHNANPLKGSEIVMAVPEQQILVTGSVNLERSSSRWPKAEIHALINLRSGLEARYQEAGPKGPLWEAISAGMLGLGYKRNAKRCKEKWENINKYFKKVKESSKKRPEDAKTCPYFYQLDELYRRKIIGGNDAGASTSGVGSINQSELQQQHQQQPPPQQQQSVTVLEYPKTSNGKRNDTGGQETPEDIMKEQHYQDPQQNLLNYDRIQAPANDNLEQADDEEDYEDDLDNNNDDDDSEATEEAMMMGYKIQFQRQNTGSSNGGRNGASSFLAMVQ